MTTFETVCLTALVVLALVALLARQLHRLYEAERRLARNANREHDGD